MDNTRFLSMVAIVALHSISAAAGLLHIPGTSGLPQMLLTLVKFGTIAFFLLSGFLLGHGFEQGSRATFVSRRLRKVFVPWAIWFVLTAAKPLVGGLLKLHPYLEVNTSCGQLLATVVKNTLTETSFWFVPNLLLSVCLLLCVRRYLRSWILGAMLFSITGFYVVNIYEHWIPPSHTLALGGFGIYLWLGALMSRHYAWLVEKAAKVPLAAFVGLAGMTGLLSLGESSLLGRLGSSDCMNTLRLSNQIYSVAVVLLILKLRGATWPRFIDARNQLFGVYLSHWLILTLVVTVLTRAGQNLPGLPGLQSAASMGGVSLALTVLVFGASIALTQLLARHGMGWMMGDLSTGRNAAPEFTGARLLSVVPVTQPA